MSKSPSMNIFAPAFGVAALVIGVAYGVASRDYGKDRIAALEDRMQTQSLRSSETAAQLDALQSSFADLQETAAADLAAQTAASESEIAALRDQLANRPSGTAAPAATAVASPVSDQPLGLGRAALGPEIAAWDVDVLPDGRGLPGGSGDVWTGEEVFGEKCASCHGDFAEGRDNWPVLAGGFDTLADEDPVKTVGSYWPYLSTVWDYVHRSMPFGNAGTLTNDEVYAITAYILYSNDLVEDDFTLSRDTFFDVTMNNTAGFRIDDRPSDEYAAWRTAPCMSDCKPAPARITRRSRDVGVTPADDGSMAPSDMETKLATLGGVEWGAERLAGSVFMDGRADDGGDQTQTASTAPNDAATTGPALDPAMVAMGEKAFKKCKACHEVGAGARDKTGPQLNAVMGRAIGTVDGYGYSNAFKKLAQEGGVWDDAAMTDFLKKPKSYVKGTKMSFSGFKKEEDIAAIIAYLRSVSQ